MLLNSEIAELLGTQVGDGTLYKTKNCLVWEFRGVLKEKEYYVKNICPLLKKIFGLNMKSKFRSGGNNGCWGVQTSRKEITSFFIKYGFTPGKKTHTVKIPQYIFESNKGTKRSFVRRLFEI